MVCTHFLLYIFSKYLSYCKYLAVEYLIVGCDCSASIAKFPTLHSIAYPLPVYQCYTHICVKIYAHICTKNPTAKYLLNFKLILYIYILIITTNFNVHSTKNKIIYLKYIISTFLVICCI